MKCVYIADNDIIMGNSEYTVVTAVISPVTVKISRGSDGKRTTAIPRDGGKTYGNYRRSGNTAVDVILPFFTGFQ